MNTTDLHTLRADELRHERAVQAELSICQPYGHEHRRLHGLWQYHRGRRELLDELLAYPGYVRAAAAARERTMVSGYYGGLGSSYMPGIGLGPVYEPPDYDTYCFTCNNDPCSCNQPPHDAAYMAAWRGGAFDDDLVGWSEELAYVGVEALLHGEGE